MLQELMGSVVPPLGRISWYPSIIASTSLVVAGWGYFLIQGVLDPLGGINSLWPLFGISNQLLAGVALCVGTTLIIKSGKARYAWVTLVPLAWLLTVTLTASWYKIFSPDPRLGFLAHADATAAKVASGATPAATGTRLIFNDRMDATITGLFVLVTMVLVVASIRCWLAVLRGRQVASVRETPFVETSYAS
jgi:carbon starvation protein